MHWLHVNRLWLTRNPPMGREGQFIWWYHGNPYLWGRICNTLWVGEKLNKILMLMFLFPFISLNGLWPSWGGRVFDIGVGMLKSRGGCWTSILRVVPSRSCGGSWVNLSRCLGHMSTRLDACLGEYEFWDLGFWYRLTGL